MRTLGGRVRVRGGSIGKLRHVVGGVAAVQHALGDPAPRGRPHSCSPVSPQLEEEEEVVVGGFEVGFWKKTALSISKVELKSPAKGSLVCEVENSMRDCKALHARRVWRRRLRRRRKRRPRGPSRGARRAWASWA